MKNTLSQENIRFNIILRVIGRIELTTKYLSVIKMTFAPTYNYFITVTFKNLLNLLNRWQILAIGHK